MLQQIASQPSFKLREIALQRRLERLRNPTRAEERFHVLIVRAGLGEGVELEFPIFHGTSFSLADFFWPTRRLDVELDGIFGHKGREREDAERDAALLGLGIKTLRVSNDMVFREPQRVIEVLGRTLREQKM
jgi:very-short-patch-repair endonuclease